jgi:RND family efflux transporter MFP subunit
MKSLDEETMRSFYIRFKNNRLIVFVAVAALCSFAATAALYSKPAPESAVKHPDITPQGMPVSVQWTTPASRPAVITALGEVVPVWQSTIKARVEGPVVYISSRLEAGNRVKAGELLVRIDHSNLQMQVSDARSLLAEARIEQLREKQEAREARLNWKRAGITGEPASTLVLRGPQLEAVQSSVEARQAALAFAETQLGYTEIRAPYDGVIIGRSVNPGETLFVGDEVFTLFGMQSVEVSVHLDADQWDLLGEMNGRTPVRLVSLQQGTVWQAHVVRDSHHLDRESRLRTLYLRVDRPLSQTPPLLPGSFVRAEITGRSIPDLVCIPETALTQKGRVWLVDDDSRLQSRAAQPVFYGEGVVYIRHPEPSLQQLRVAVTPNTSYANGLLVQALTEKRG